MPGSSDAEAANVPRETMAADLAKVEAICELVALGESQTSACRSMDVDESTFRAWRRAEESIDTRYARAREDRAHLWAEQLMGIADTPEEGRKTTIKPDGTEEVVIGDMLEHRKLRIDARKWMMARILPKQYGDRLVHAGDDENPLTIKSILVPERIATKPSAEPKPEFGE